MFPVVPWLQPEFSSMHASCCTQVKLKEHHPITAAFKRFFEDDSIKKVGPAALLSFALGATLHVV